MYQLGRKPEDIFYDPEVTMDNNETEASLGSFCLHNHAWKVIDIIEGSKQAQLFTVLQKQ